MAEAFYNHLTKSNSASSAGIDHATPEKYSSPTKEVIEVMSEEGIDVSKKKVKTITEEMLRENDKVFVMYPRGKCPNFLSKSSKVKFWRIKDPYGKGKRTTRDVRDTIKKKILGILP